MIQEIEGGHPESQSNRRERRVISVGQVNAVSAATTAVTQSENIQLILKQKEETMAKKGMSADMLALMESAMNVDSLPVPDDDKFFPTYGTSKAKVVGLRSGRTLPGPFYKARKKKNRIARRSRAKNRK